MTNANATVLAAFIGVFGAIVGQLVPAFIPRLLTQHIFTGAVCREDANPENRAGISGVQVTAHALDGSLSPPVVTDSQGKFVLPLSFDARKAGYVNLSFKHADYQETNSNQSIADAFPATFYLWPIPPQGAGVYPPPRQPQFSPAAFILMAAYLPEDPPFQKFQVPNRGNVRCGSGQTCSPDGKWKASKVSVSLDAPPGKVFVKGHADCIAGPCPWTTVYLSGQGGHKITATVINWSDTVTYKLWGELGNQ